IRDGDLEGARAALVEAVRADPADARRRLALAEVLIVAGDLERADTHLNAAQGLDTSFGMAVALTRQLIRAATWRAETFDGGRPPELVTERTPSIDNALAALLTEREGGAGPVDDDPALSAITGTVDDRGFTGWRDADDRTAGVLELLTSTGNYVWVPLAQVRSLRLVPVERLRDIVWRPAEIEVANGPTGVVYLPAIYHAAAAEMTPLHRLGRVTDWVEGSLVRGLGQRVWLIGDDDVALSDFTELTIA
ncbi:MAG: type VI secretion system accessory protein TagJ, partial [Janthinobacterium lividum]